MCGIFGVIDHPSIDRDRFKKALALLHHRGPDATNVRFWEQAAFGFTRLAVQDLSANGNQPMTLSDNGLTIVFNGEIYNFKILREKLKKEGRQFFSNTDTEVILHAFHNWGWEETLNVIEGKFAMAIFDKESGVFHLARDRFGQVPLFFSQHPEFGFIFASELKSIVEYVGSAAIDARASMNPLFTTGLPPRGKSCFKDIQQLEPGEYLQYELAKGRFKKGKYFQVSDLVSEDLYQELSGYTDDKMLEIYEKTFDESVQLHLLSDAPLACLFSAGVDSSLIAALGARYTPLKLYHFESEEHDFQRFYKSFAEKFSLPLKVVKGKDENYIFDIPKLTWHNETINKPEGVVLGHLCSMARKEGVKVLLTGGSSDELFGGYDTAVDFAISNAAHNSHVSSFSQKALNKVFPHNFTRYSRATPLGTTYNHMPFMANLNEVPLNYFYHEGLRLEEWQNCLETYSFIKDPNERAISAFLIDEIGYRLQRFMIRDDRFGMMNSVELRSPFLFTPLVRLAVNTPLSWRLRQKSFWRGYETKYVVKRLAKKVGVKRSLAFRKKLGTPFNHQLKVQHLLRHLNLENLSGLLEIPVPRIRHIALESFDKDLARIQFAFLTMEIMIRMFVEGESHEELTEQFKAICMV